MLEETIVERRPAYKQYIESTNAFIPGPKKMTSYKEEVQQWKNLYLV